MSRNDAKNTVRYIGIDCEPCDGPALIQRKTALNSVLYITKSREFPASLVAFGRASSFGTTIVVEAISANSAWQKPFLESAYCLNRMLLPGTASSHGSSSRSNVDA